MTEVNLYVCQKSWHFKGDIMDLMTLLLVWCGVHLNSVSICLSGSNPLCELSVDVNGTHLCYWVIFTQQDATSSETKCKLDNGSLAYIPNEDVLLEASAFVTQQLGIGFVYIGYTRTVQAFFKIRGTDHLQSWVAWDAAFGQPNNGGECVAIFTETGKFHDIPCTEKFYALCSTLNSTEITTAVSFDTTNDPTTEITTDVTTDVTVDNNADVNVTDNTACHCDCNARRSIVIYPIINITKELQAKLDTLKKETEVNEEMLSSTIRTKTCASDPRPSSAYVGYLGIVLLTVIFGGILLVDLPRVIMTIKTFC